MARREMKRKYQRQADIWPVWSMKPTKAARMRPGSRSALTNQSRPPRARRGKRAFDVIGRGRGLTYDSPCGGLVHDAEVSRDRLGE